MSRVPRPVTKLSDEQRRLAEEAADAADTSRAATEAAWQKLLAARLAGVPDDYLCQRTGFSRSTLNRKFGRRQDAEPES